MDGHFLGGGFKYFLFSPLFGEDSHFGIFWLIFFKGVGSTTNQFLTGGYKVGPKCHDRSK